MHHNSKPLHAIGALAMVCIWAAIGTAIVMGLWNSIVSPVCGFATINFVQALGLLTLGLTFSGAILFILMFIGHIFRPHHMDNRHALLKKWHEMSDEQKREFLHSRGFTVDKND